MLREGGVAQVCSTCLADGTGDDNVRRTTEITCRRVNTYEPCTGLSATQSARIAMALYDSYLNYYSRSPTVVQSLSDRHTHARTEETRLHCWTRDREAR